MHINLLLNLHITINLDKRTALDHFTLALITKTSESEDQCRYCSNKKRKESLGKHEKNIVFKGFDYLIRRCICIRKNIFKTFLLKDLVFVCLGSRIGKPSAGKDYQYHCTHKGKQHQKLDLGHQVPVLN